MAEQIIEADIGAVASLVGDPSRASMLQALMAAESLAVSELARVAGVRLSTASEHLRRLEEGGLVRSARRGRGRFFSLAGSDVATALEALAIIAPPLPVRSLRQSIVASRLAEARTCYDHLAGKLGVALLSDLIRRQAVRPRDVQLYEITRRGERLMAELGIDTSALRRGTRTLARACLDWTEREPHLAGAIGAAICEAVMARGWAMRRDRVVEVTEVGRAGFVRWLGRRSRVASCFRAD